MGDVNSPTPPLLVHPTTSATSNLLADASVGVLLERGGSKTSEEGKDSNSLEGKLRPRGACSHIQFEDGGMFIGGVK